MKRVFSFLIQKRLFILFSLVLLGVYWTNAFHTNFPDEFDNIVGGWYINKGILPYIGFFSHHNPGSYYLASIITFFTGQSFVAFRKVFAIVLFMGALGSWYILRNRVGKTVSKVWPVYLLSMAITSTYYWGHMILSETIVGYTLVPAYVLVFLKEISEKKLNLIDFGVVSLLAFAALFTSFTYLFASVVLLTYVGVRYSMGIIPKINTEKKDWVEFCKKILYLIGIFVFPYILFLMYLLITGSFSEFVFQSIDYNRDYYIYNFPTVSGQVSTHPVRYAISIFHNTTLQFLTLSTQITSFNFSYPVNITLLLGNLGLLIYLISKRRFGLALMVYTFLIYLNARGEPLNSKETDFHSTVYIMASIFHLIFVLTVLWKEIGEKINESPKVLYKFLLILVGIYAIFTTLYFVRNWESKVYLRFMGQAPGIYDEPVAAPIINKIVPPDEYFWIGPFEFQELLYINARLPSKYHWFLPASSRSEKIKSELKADLLRNKPTLIVFKDFMGFFGMTGSEFNSTIVDFLNEHYFRLKDLEVEGMHLKPTLVNLHNFDIEQHFYFDKEKKGAILERLWKEKLVETK